MFSFSAVGNEWVSTAEYHTVIKWLVTSLIGWCRWISCTFKLQMHLAATWVEHTVGAVVQSVMLVDGTKKTQRWDEEHIQVQTQLNPQFDCLLMCLNDHIFDKTHTHLLPEALTHDITDPDMLKAMTQALDCDSCDITKLCNWIFLHKSHSIFFCHRCGPDYVLTHWRLGLGLVCVIIGS